MRKGRLCLYLTISALSLSAASPSDIENDLRQGQRLQSQGLLKEAQLRFRSALTNAVGIPEEPEMQVSALSNLASVEIDLAHNDAAARLYNRAIGILQSSSGNHLSAIDDIHMRLAELYLDSAETGTAKKLIQTVIAGQRARNSTETPGAAFALDIQACIFGYERKFRAAEAAERDALAILELPGRQDGGQYITATMHLASFLNSQKRPASALPYAQKSLALIRALVVRQPALEAGSEMILASIYSMIGQPEEAFHAAEAARRTTQDYYGLNHPRTATMLLAEAAVLRKIGRKSDARQSQTEGERIMTANTGAGVSVTVPVEALLPR